MSRFEDKTVLVTGASRGLGRAIARAFAREGAFVAIGYHRRHDDAEQTLAELHELGAEGSKVAFDVADAGAVATAVEALVAERGRLDVAVANAGVAEDCAFVLQEPASFARVLAANLMGTANLCRVAARAMLKQGGGAIVTVASVAGRMASPGQSSYAASKGAIVALTSTLGAELARKGVRVNCVAPGLLTTGMASRLDHRVLGRKKELIPLGRLGDADEVARAVLFLASSDASYVVGQTLVVDGGLTA
jgi:3-oxoacyl-[acyl-carrier protein] reductase